MELWNSIPCPVVAHICATSAPVACSGGELTPSQASRLRHLLNRTTHCALLSLSPASFLDALYVVQPYRLRSERTVSIETGIYNTLAAQELGIRCLQKRFSQINPEMEKIK